MNIYELFSRYSSFMAFDISVKSTGWCKYADAVLSYGSFGLKSDSELGRRMEFRDNAIKLIGDATYDFIGIEDVIGGCNFETTKILIQLNSIIDDLAYLGNIRQTKIERIGNGVWKKYLKTLADYRGIVAGHAKDDIVSCLNKLGFSQDGVQDIYDAVGIAVGVICRNSADLQFSSDMYISNTSGISAKTRLKTDLTKSYKFSAYTDDNIYVLRNLYGVEVVELEYDSRYRDMILQFKDCVNTYGDNFIFILNAPLEKYGVLSLTGALPVSDTENRFLAYKKSLKRKYGN